MIDPIGGLPAILGDYLLQAFREWRAGPRTEESEALRSEAESRRATARELLDDAIELDRKAFEVRLGAKRARPTWLNKNREALTIGIVASLIAGVPFFVLGVLLTLALG